MDRLRWNRLFGIILVVILTLSLQPFPVKAEGQTYVVQPGETLFRIALRYGLTVDALAAANHIADPTHIVAGQVLIIPDANAANPAAPAAPANPPPAAPANAVPPANAAPVYYTVQAGDTLNSIARKFGLNMQDIANANGMSDPNHLHVGQQILIPGAKAPGSSATVPSVPAPDQPAPNAQPPANPQPQPAAPANTTATTGRTHVVKPGEGLAAIGRLYGISWPTIAAANNINDPNTIYAGMVLKIPDSDINPTTMTTSNGVPPGPNPPTTPGKSITVVLHEQRVYAYENGNLVRNVLVSTGLPGTPTVQGDFKIYVKYTAQLMTGPGYYLPGVPWVMYFYEGYSFHGTYWHHNWGHPMSHGCVNMPTDEALWLYRWAEIGTPVHVQW
jgi:LysM repeat protein